MGVVMSLRSVEDRLYRQAVVAEALMMFPDEKFVGDAIRKYNELLLPEERVPVRITTDTYGHGRVSELDLIQRPECPTCGTAMSIRRLGKNDDGFKTQLSCLDPKCDTVVNSEFTYEEWYDACKEAYEAIRNAK